MSAGATQATADRSPKNDLSGTRASDAADRAAGSPGPGRRARAIGPRFCRSGSSPGRPCYRARRGCGLPRRGRSAGPADVRQVAGQSGHRRLSAGSGGGLMTRVAIVRFPGSNCDFDTLRAAQSHGGEAYFVWHRDTDLKDADIVILPGGFSYGDYLRTGAIARFSPIMGAVQRHAADGGPLLGICNGFQIMCEAQLLPGALLRNAGLTFVSKPVDVIVERTDTAFTYDYEPASRLRLPVGHGEGRYVASAETLRMLETEGRVVLRYVAATERSPFQPNPNGATNHIAGISNAEGNVVGIMPHPERAADRLLGLTGGSGFFTSMVTSDHESST